MPRLSKEERDQIDACCNEYEPDNVELAEKDYTSLLDTADALEADLAAKDKRIAELEAGLALSDLLVVQRTKMVKDLTQLHDLAVNERDELRKLVELVINEGLNTRVDPIRCWEIDDEVYEKLKAAAAKFAIQPAETKGAGDGN